VAPKKDAGIKKEPAAAKPDLGGLSTRGETLTGRVVGDKMKKTVIVERDVIKYLPKYRKSARSNSRIVAHNPESVGARVGDIVSVAETRKISKTKAWAVVGIISRAGEDA